MQKQLKSYRELDVWKKAIELCEAVYVLTAKFPGSERYGLSSQLQRAAVSIAANIAEGYGRSHRGDYLHHLSISRGSLMEVETHLTLSVRLKLASRADVVGPWRLSQAVGQMLTKLIASLRPETRNPKPETRQESR
jgi:four helix bundle protein